MSQDVFERDLAAAFRDYVAAAPTTVDAVAYTRAIQSDAAHPARPRMLPPARKRGWLLVAALLAIALVAAVALGPGTRTAIIVPPPSERVSSSPTERPEPTQRIVTPSPVPITPPDAEPILAYMRDGDIWLHTEIGGQPTLAAESVGVKAENSDNSRWMYWSPDGATVAFRSLTYEGPGGRKSTYSLLDAETLAIRPRADAVISEVVWGWTPDSRGFLVTARTPPTGLKSTDVDNGQIEQLSFGEVCQPVFSPDGARIAATLGDTLVVASTTSYEWRVIGPYAGFDCGPFTGWDAPTWSPDSNRVAFVSGTDGRKGGSTPFDALRTTITVAETDGSNARDLTDDAAPFGRPLWSPDGELIAFRGLEGLSLIRPNGSDERVIVRGDVDRGRVAWAPDSSRIYYGVPADPVHGGVEIWTYDMASGSARHLETGGSVTEFAVRP
jgi:dipeptidyl aminopeptidase/acylaminoacyl peptidase